MARNLTERIYQVGGEELRHMDGRIYTESNGIIAALQGRSYNYWVDKQKNASSDPTILTAAGSFVNLTENQIIAIESLFFAVYTSLDEVNFEIGYTDQIDCAGTFHALGPRFPISTDSLTNSGQIQSFENPVVLRYSSGVRCVCWRTTAIDTNAEYSVSFSGYWVNP